MKRIKPNIGADGRASRRALLWQIVETAQVAQAGIADIRVVKYEGLKLTEAVQGLDVALRHVWLA